MDEYQALAVAAVEALQAANQPKWTEMVGAFIGIAQCGLIAWGISLMNKSNESRAAMNQLMVDQGKALEKVGTSLDQQSQALAVVLERSQSTT
jgi:hypothetical protein